MIWFMPKLFQKVMLFQFRLNLLNLEKWLVKAALLGLLSVSLLTLG